VIIFAGLALVALCVWAGGGDLRLLSTLEVRAKAAILGALALQVGIITIAPTAFPEWVASVLHLGSYGLAVVFLWCNRRLPALWIATAGGALNLLAITANGGEMPASSAALRSSGLAAKAKSGFTNSGNVAHARLAFLGDIFSVPKGVPFANVFSVGDIVLLIGAAAMLVSVCGLPRLTRRVPDVSKA
jgi:hypothetical protein